MRLAFSSQEDTIVTYPQCCVTSASHSGDCSSDVRLQKKRRIS